MSIAALLANWKMLALGLLVAALGVQTLRLSWAQNELISDKLAQADAVRKAQDRADDLSNELIIAQAQAMAQITQTLQPSKERIASAPLTAVCRDSPAIRAAIDGVRNALGPGGGKTR